MAGAGSQSLVPDRTDSSADEGWRGSVWLRFLMLLIVLFVFFVAINLMGSSLKALTKSTVKDLLAKATANPLAALMLGILATSIIQSSSTTTSIVVTFAATGIIELRAAIPMVMGANIGTTVTNTLVSFTHFNRKQEFERALAAGTVHDWFNILATLVLFPLEITTHVIEKAAVWLKATLIGTSFGNMGGLKDVINPIVKFVSQGLGSSWLTLLLAVLVLFLSLGFMVKIMRSIFLQKMARILDRFLFRNAATAFVVGICFTILVQSSSVTTSLIVPLVGAGILSLEQVFPYTLGANIGTTVTAFLAALALAAGAESVDPIVGVGVTVALVHLLFNIFGIAIVYPFRRLPIRLARWLASTMTHSKKRAILFLLCYFGAYTLPLLLMLIF